MANTKPSASFLGVGTIRQIKTWVDFAEVTTTSTSFVDATGRNVSFTPTATDSVLNILYYETFGGELGTTHGIIEVGISRGLYASGVYLHEANISRNSNGSANWHYRYNGVLSAWDEPNTVSATTYNIYWKVGDGSTTGCLGEGSFQRTGTTSANNKGNSITIIEYAPADVTAPTYTD